MQSHGMEATDPANYLAHELGAAFWREDQNLTT